MNLSQDKYMKGYIYEIKNKNNDKSYIGQTIQKLQKRWNNHNNSTTYIGNAINKHGKENFLYSIIEEIDLNDKNELRNKLNILEKQYIEKFNTFNKGYNETTGGDAYNLSKEACKKIGEANRGKVRTQEFKNKLSEINKGKKLSKEHRKKISEANKGNKSALGVKHTEKSRANMSKAQKGHHVSIEQRNKIRDNNLIRYSNMSYSEKRELTKKANESRKKKVICIETGIVYNFVLEAQNSTGIIGIGSVCNGKRKTAGGYKWGWYEEKI